MPSFKPKELWEADPHTIAKNEIVKQYLLRWFLILGKQQRKRLLYIDGFAGPGKYLNTDQSSPTAAISAITNALAKKHSVADNRIHLLFVEKEEWAAQHLKGVLQSTILPKCVTYEVRQGTFSAQIDSIFSDNLKFQPTFAFLDPFGATQLPFRDIARILRNESCEVLLNLDSDGAVRILKAKSKANEANMDELFGDKVWRTSLDPRAPSKELAPQVLSLYKQRLLAIPGVRYVFAFTMQDRRGQLNYHLVFASQHPLGLIKMKEAMEYVDKSGTYSFCDAYVGQQELAFNFREPQPFAERMAHTLGGQYRPYSEFNDFALNETPFKSPKAMLEQLKSQGRIAIKWNGEPAKQGFPEDKIESICIGKPIPKQVQMELV